MFDELPSSGSAGGPDAGKRWGSWIETWMEIEVETQIEMWVKKDQIDQRKAKRKVWRPNNLDKKR